MMSAVMTRCNYTNLRNVRLVMPALVAGIHALNRASDQRRGWPGQARPGHGERSIGTKLGTTLSARTTAAVWLQDMIASDYCIVPALLAQPLLSQENRAAAAGTKFTINIW